MVARTPALAPGLLAGRTAWITGGGSGLGRAMALRFAQLGASLVLTGRRREPLEATAAAVAGAGGRAAVAPADVRDPGQVATALAEGLRAFGALDILINNAAGNFLCRSEDLSPNAFASVVGIVLNGTFHCTQAAGRHWIEAKRPGTVLSVATTYAHTGSAFVLPSACGKAGVVALTRSLAVEWARYRIRLNAIAPGPIPTEGAFSRLIPSGDMVEERIRRIPAGRLGTPEELAEMAAWMVSDATEWMRGEVVTFDGGEWLRGAGEFSDLLEMEIDWEALRPPGR